MTAPTRTFKLCAADDADGTSYVTSSLTITAGARALIGLLVHQTEAVGVPSPPSSVTGTSISGAALVATGTTFGVGSSVVHRLFLYSATGTGSAGTITVNFPLAQTGIAYGIIEYSHASGTPPLGTAVEAVDSDYNSTQTVTVAALANADSVIFGWFAAASAATMAAGTNLTILGGAVNTSPGGESAVGGGGNVTALTCTTTSYGEEQAGIAVEVQAPSAAAAAEETTSLSLTAGMTQAHR